MKQRVRVGIFAFISVFYLGLGARVASAAGVECALVEPDLVAVDGMADEWGGVSPRIVARGVSVRCAQDDTRLYLAIAVQDDAVIRTGGGGRANQDRLRLRIGAKRTPRWAALEVLPSTRGFESIATFQGRRPRGPLEIVDNAQADGWLVEAALPLSELPGYGRGTPALRYDVAYRDKDGGGAHELRGAGPIFFAGSRQVYEGFMRDVGLSYRKVHRDSLANVVGGKGFERVIIGGRVIGVLDNSYRYIQLPISRPDDLLGVQVVDLAGAGKSSILTHYREHGNGGSREVVAVWNVTGDGQFTRTLAFEVAKRMGSAHLTNRWRLEPRSVKKGAKRRPAGKGFDIVVEVADVAGWNEQNYGDVPPQDMRPILVPWGEQTSAVYHFEGDQSFGGEPY